MTEKLGFEKNRILHVEFGNQPCEAYGVRFRSTEERRWADYLEWLKRSKEVLSWAYEPVSFEFEERYRKKGQYTPDFLVIWADGLQEFHEVKADMRQWQKVVSKFRRLRADYPMERIVLVFPSCPSRSTRRIEKMEKAKKYVDDVIYSGPIFRQLGL